MFGKHMIAQNPLLQINVRRAVIPKIHKLFAIMSFEKTNNILWLFKQQINARYQMIIIIWTMSRSRFKE